MWQFIARLFTYFVKAVADAREKGRQDVIKEAHHEADQRKKQAEAIDQDWRDLNADQRERLRDQHGHYRD